MKDDPGPLMAKVEDDYPKEKVDSAIHRDSLNALPPAYSDAPPEAPPDIVAAFADLNLERKEKKPTPDQCIAHLKLLEAIHQLREDVGGTDGLYGIFDRFASDLSDGPWREKTLTKLKEKRWGIFVLLAARRFEKWFLSLEQGTRMLTLADMESTKYSTQEKSKRPIEFTVETMPPLDVLMVWHAFILNPRRFLSDCLRNGRVGLWRAGMPWKVIMESIDNQSFEYKPSETAQKTFTSATGLAWNALDDSPSVRLECPSCKQAAVAELTTATTEAAWSKESGVGGHGFADRDFKLTCHCGLIIDHELLRAQRFRKDLQLLMVHHVPMPGTLLSLDGLNPCAANIGVAREARNNSTFRSIYPNRLLLAGAGAKIADITQIASMSNPKQATDLNGITSVDDIRKSLEASMKNKDILRKASSIGRSPTVFKEERIAIRKMMACYWDNASVFHLDLAGATLRQNVFVEKMHDIDWLHSPALRATMKRLIEKYGNFFTIMRTFPKDVAVPTLDVDLAWHTHQLDPPMYREYSEEQTNIFIDHDDKIDENKLSTSFEWTSKTYEKMFMKVYSECTCWYCEAIRESHTSRMSRLFKSKGDADDDLKRLHEGGGSMDPHKSPHISAHNAIKSQSNPDTKTAVYVRQHQLERNYQRAVSRAKKEGRDPPRRDDYYYYPYWGYYYPQVYYAPYMGDPCMTAGMYPANPACANFGAGAVGNCCAGSCGGAVAAGACAGGSGAGSCGGGTGAGCGGGGMGGGGGCGGGGGGGGCGGGGGGGGCGGGGG